jgi:hypothetical protein
MTAAKAEKRKSAVGWAVGLMTSFDYFVAIR